MSNVSVWEQQWPDVFARLDDRQRASVTAALVHGHREAEAVDREFVELLVDRATGVIDFAEFERRGMAWAGGR